MCHAVSAFAKSANLATVLYVLVLMVSAYGLDSGVMGSKTGDNCVIGRDLGAQRKPDEAGPNRPPGSKDKGR